MTEKKKKAKLQQIWIRQDQVDRVRDLKIIERQPDHQVMEVLLASFAHLQKNDPRWYMQYVLPKFSLAEGIKTDG